MQCVVDVRPNTRRMKTISMDDSGITAVALNSIDSPATNEPCRSSSPDSFYDSDDVLSNESGDDEEAGHLITIGQQPSSISHTLLVGNSGDPQDIGDIDLVDIIRHVSPVDQCQPAPEQKLRSVSVYIDEYSFRPDTLKCKVGCIVQFLLAPNSSGCRISCDGEFSGIEISPSNAKYLHNFEKGRVYEVYNEVMNFITCRLEVVDNDVAAILPSASPTPHENHYQVANHSPGDKESLPMKLFGSFIPIKPTPVVEISAVDDDDLSVMTLLSGRVRVDSASLSSSDDGLGFKSDEENDGDVDATAADLESCTEGLSRAAKKRLKYKLRVKKRKQENQELKEIGPITEGEALSASVGKKKTNKKKKKKASTKNSDHSLAQSQSEPVSSSPKIGDVVDLPPPYASMTGVETNISDSVGLPTVLVNGDLVATMSPLRPASYTLATTDWSEDIDIEEEDEMHSQSGLQSPPPYAALVTQSDLESSSSLLRKDASLPGKELETTETENGDSHQHGAEDFGEEIGSDVDSLRAANGVYDNSTVSSASTDSFEDFTGHIALDDVTSILVPKDNHEIHSNDLDSNAPAANDADSIVSELGESDDEIDHSESVVALNDSISIPVDTIGVATTFRKRSILLSALGLKQEAVPTPAPASIPPITAPTSTPLSVAQTKYDAGKVVAISSVKVDALSVPIASDAVATSANGRAKIDGSEATETTVLSTQSTANSKSADTATASATKASVDTKDIAPPKPSPTLVDVVKGANKSTKASLVPFNATEVANETAAESKVVAPSTSSVKSPKSPAIASSQISNTSSMSLTKAIAAETSAPPIQIRTSKSDTTSGLPLSSKSSMSTHQISVSDVVQQAAIIPKAVSIPTGQVSEKDIPKKGPKGKKAKPIEPVNSKTEVKEVDDIPKPAVVVSTTKASLDAPVATLAHSPSADESTDVYNEANDEIIQLLLQSKSLIPHTLIVNPFLMRSFHYVGLAEAERMADNQSTETLPRGKVVGVFRYESLPFHKTVEKTATTDTPRSVSTGVTSFCATPQDSPVDGSTIVTPSPERPPTARNPAKSKAKPVPASLRPSELSQKSDELHSRSTSDVINNPNASVGATPSSVRPGKDSNMRYRGNRHKNKETS